MKRREVRILLGGAAAGWPRIVRAQESASVARIGYLATGTLESPEVRALLDAFQQGLRERGLVEGQNLIVEYQPLVDLPPQLLAVQIAAEEDRLHGAAKL
jgi:putative tryptophan/tyrosine transport system substrate-binding protein